MRRILPQLITDGRGIFTDELIKETARRGIALKVVGFDPWADVGEEVHGSQAL